MRGDVVKLPTVRSKVGLSADMCLGDGKRLQMRCWIQRVRAATAANSIQMHSNRPYAGGKPWNLQTRKGSTGGKNLATLKQQQQQAASSVGMHNRRAPNRCGIRYVFCGKKRKCIEGWMIRSRSTIPSECLSTGVCGCGQACLTIPTLQWISIAREWCRATPPSNGSPSLTPRPCVSQLNQGIHRLHQL